jgi:hypothetical protein
MTEKVLVKALCVLPSAGQPGGDRRMPVALRPARQRKHLVLRPAPSARPRPGTGRGFQPVHGSVTSSSEGGAAGLTPKRLNPLDTAMLAISDQGVDVSIGDPGVRALRVGTGETLGVHPLGCSPSAFHLAPGPHRQRRWTSTRRGAAGEATSGAIKWGAWLEEAVEQSALGCCSRLSRTMMGPAKETQPCEREQEDTQEQKQEHVMRHKDPHSVKFEGWKA